MSSLLLWTIGASVLTAVTDWAGWHFVWRHEFGSGEAVKRKRNITSLFFSYVLPFIPALVILLGPAKVGLYDSGFATVGAKVMFVLMAVLTAGVAASAWSVGQRHHEEKDARELIDQKDILPPHAMEHLLWTTIMLVVCAIGWLLLLTI